MMETATTPPPSLYWKTCAALMFLLGLTWSVAYVDLGLFNLVFALAVALLKALLVALFFMQIRRGSRLFRLVGVAGLVWLGILLTQTLSDYLSRGWVPLNH
jgi:cytochrome c oxidase subunit 4